MRPLKSQRLLAVVLLAGLAGCSDEAPERAPAVGQTQAPQVPASGPSNTALFSVAAPVPAPDLCAELRSPQPAPGWKGEALQVQAGSSSSAIFPATAAESAVVILQNGDGHGAGEALSAEVTLNGVQVIALSPGQTHAVARVSLAASNTLAVSASGSSGAVRASVAPAVAPPCALGTVDAVRKPGKPTASTARFNRPGPASLGVLLVDIEGNHGEVKLNGVDLLGTATRRGEAFAVAVALKATNTLEVTPMGAPGTRVRAVVFDADTTPPLFTLAAPDEGWVTSTTPISASGTAAEDVVRVEVSGVLAARKGAAYSASVPLTVGRNAVAARATDHCGNVARDCRNVILDSAPPVITVSGVTDGEITQERVTPIWNVTEDNPKSSSATLNGAPFQSGTPVDEEGEFHLVVEAEDLGGLRSRVELRFSILRTPPVISISGFSEGEHRSGDVTPVFSATSPHLDVVTATLNDAPSFQSGTPVTAEGTYTLVVHARDLAGNTSQLSRTFTIDRTAPAIELLGVAEGEHRNETVTLTFGATDLHLVSVEGRLEGGVVQSGVQVATEGAYTLVVIAVDRAGNRASLSRSFVIDLTAPVITVSGVEAGGLYNATVRPVYAATDAHLVSVSAVLGSEGFASGSAVTQEGEHRLVVTASDRAGNQATTPIDFELDLTVPAIQIAGVSEGQFSPTPLSPTFTATDRNLASVTAQLNGGDFQSGTQISEERSHTLVVTATDRAGNSDQSSVSFTLDFSKPVVTVTGIADGEHRRDPVTITFAATDAHLDQVSATLNGDPFTSGSQVSAEREHVLVVSATDLAGNAESTTVHFTVDRTAPEIVFSGVEEGAHLAAPVTPGFEATDTYLSTVTATLNDEPYTEGTEVSAERAHRLVVVATDRAGNVATRALTFTLDFKAPVISVQGVEAGGHYKAPVTLTYSAADDHLASVTAKLDDQDFASGQSVSTAGDHLLTVTARDQAGNTQTETFAFTLDLTPPTLTITGVVDGERRRLAATITYSAEDAHLAALEATLDEEAFSSGGVVSAPGEHVLVVTATDKAGNERVEQRTFTLDQQPPTLTVVSPSDGWVTAESSVQLVLEAEEDGPAPEITVGGTPLVRGEDGRYRGTFSLLEGGNLFTALAFDAAGNSAEASVSVISDTKPPQLALTAPEEGAFVGALSVQVTGTVTETNLRKVTVNGLAAILEADGTFTAAAQLAPGNNTLTVVAVDEADHTTTVTRQVRANAQAPLLSVSEPVDGFTFDGAFLTVRGTASVADPEDSPAVTVDGTAVAVGATGAFATTVPFEVGTRLVTIRVEDRYALFSEEVREVTRVGIPDGGTSAPDGGSGGGEGSDAGTPVEEEPEPPPVLRIGMPAEGEMISGETVAVTGRVDDGALPLTVTVNGVPAAVSSRYFTAAISSLEGPLALAVRVTDAVGRSAEATRTVTVDRTRPFLELSQPTTNPATVDESPYRIVGTAGDAHLADVRIAGVAVPVVGGQFSGSVALQAGDNDLLIEARDLAGNTRSITQRLSIPAIAPLVTILEPLEGAESEESVVEVRARVVSTATVAEVRIGTGAAPEVSPGVYAAEVPLALGTNVITVSATDSSGLRGSAQVSVRYRDPANEPLAVTGVDPVPGAEHIQPNSLISIAFNKPILPETVSGNFQVLARGQPILGGYSVAPGAQTVTFVPKAALPEGETLSVRVEDVAPAQGPGLSGSFVSQFTVRRPLTVVHGLVLDDRLEALPNVKVELVGTGYSAVTGPDGNWVVVGIPGDRQHEVRYEGRSTSDGRAFPTVRRKLYVEAEKTTSDRQVVLVPTRSDSARHVNGLEGGTISFAGVYDGLEFQVPANGLAFADGQVSGYLTATEIPPFLRPVPIEDNASLSALWQVSPARMQVLRPFRVSFPNRTGLAPGALTVVLSFDTERLVLKRTGLARVSADGAQIVGLEPVAVGSFELIGYMSLTAEQQVAVESVIAGAGGDSTSPGGVDGGALGSLMDLRRPARLRRTLSPVERLYELLVPTAHADNWLGAFYFLAPLDSFGPGFSSVTGRVRAPRPRETVIELLQPADLLGETLVALPFMLPVEGKASFESNEPVRGDGERLTLTLSAIGPNGVALSPSGGEVWAQSGLNETHLLTTLDLPVGISTLSLAASSLHDTATLRYTATLEPIIPDAGAPTHARLRFKKVYDNAEAVDPLEGSARFRGVKVGITSYNDSLAVTSEEGKYGTVVPIPSNDTMGIACAEVFAGPRYVPYYDQHTGTTQFTSVGGNFATCSVPFWMFKNQRSGADVLMDVRYLYGSVKFKNRDGTLLPAVCQDSTESRWSTEEGRRLETISAADVATTEVHFFREDNLDIPIARYSVARPDEKECPDPSEPPPAVSHARYSRIRLGPTNGSSRATRTRCAALQKLDLATLSAEDAYFLRTQCGPQSSAFMRVSPGDRLVVFAVNHATGYTGLSSVTVPPITRPTNPDPDGNCPADDPPNEPLVIEDEGRMYPLSRCSYEDLGIPASLELYPPEIDIRVARRRAPDGLPQPVPATLVRTGGAATSNDDYVKVSTHWRVRRTHVAGDTEEDPTPDADPVPDEDEPCVLGLLPDGSPCTPSPLFDEHVDRVGNGYDAGEVLEVYCSQLTPRATTEQWETCLLDDSQLTDVPSGVPPLAGHLIQVTGSANEAPVNVTFPVKPGQATATLQTALKRTNQDGSEQTLLNLPRANYYVHVVGHRVLPRDKDQDGFISEAEKESPPADFTSPPDDLTAVPISALYVKNVYRRHEETGSLAERFDLAREHEFRVLDLQPQNVTATGAAEERNLLDEDEPKAKERDLAYDFLATLIDPMHANPGRAGTLSGEFRVRLGSDEFGMDCPLTLDPVLKTIAATCGGEFLADVLSANDLLYLEVYLSGNAENVLYRFNFAGLAARKDYAAANSEYSVLAAVEPDQAGKPAAGRQVSRPPMVSFFLEPTAVKTGTVKICLNPACLPSENLVKEVLLQHQSDGSYQVTDSGRGIGQEKIWQTRTSTKTGARQFRQQLPAHLAAMPGSANQDLRQLVYLVIEPVEPAGERIVTTLGSPKGSYEGANAAAVGQEIIGGVNVADGHLSLAHADFSVPYLGGEFTFIRTYNNANNQPNPLGIGWSHNFESVLVEERVGRYLAVISGQGYAFTDCAKKPGKDDPNYGNASECSTDNSHGMRLEVTAPLELPDGATPDDKLIVSTPDGWRYEFTRMLKEAERVEGKRAWLLTRYGSPHRGEGDDGWYKLSYQDDSNLLERLEHVGRGLKLDFSYRAVDKENDDIPKVIKEFARTRNFQWLESVSLVRSDEVIIYRVEYEQEDAGNLRRAQRIGPEGPDALYQIYNYRYLPAPLTLSADERWAAVNELGVAELIHGRTPNASQPVQWRGEYGRNASKPYEHINVHEAVSSVLVTGHGTVTDGEVELRPYLIAYPSTTKRLVTRPDGVTEALTLNPYGNVFIRQVAEEEEHQTFWGSDTRGGPVRPTQLVSPGGRKFEQKFSERMVLEKVLFTPPLSGDLPIAGNPRYLLEHSLNEDLGVPESTTFPSGEGFATRSMPRDARGNIVSEEVSQDGQTLRVMSAAMYNQDGLLLSATDAQGRHVTYGDFNALGQPQKVTRSMESAAFGAWRETTRSLSYDDQGRLLGWFESPTGASEYWTFDTLGRVLTHTRSGEPEQAWEYRYIEEVDNTLTIEERLAGTGHLRKYWFKEGLLLSESVQLGEPAREVSKSYEYEGGRLERIVDEMGDTHQHHYDSAGRLERITVNAEPQVRVAYALDAEGRPYEVTDEYGRKSRVVYDVLNRPVVWDYGDGDIERVTRDAQGVITRRSYGLNEDYAVGFTLDPLGRPLTETSEDGSGGVKLKAVFDAAGRPTLLEDLERGVKETYSYEDVLGRLTQKVRTVTTRGDAALVMVETRAYVAATSEVTVSKEIDTGTELGKRTEAETLRFDTAGRLMSRQRLVDGQEATESYTYDPRGNLLTHTSPMGAVTTRSYDPLGNLVSITDAEGFTTTYALDDAGRVDLEEGPHPGYQCDYQYDDLGRLELKTVKAHGTTPETKWTYLYLTNSREWTESVTADGAEITTRRKANGRGRVVQETVTGPDGVLETSVGLDGPWEKSRTVTEGAWTSTTTVGERDDLGRVLRETETWAGGGQSYTYETNATWTGREAIVNITANTASDAAGARNETWSKQIEVDGLGNLVALTQGTFTDTWTYDAAGVLASERPHGVPQTHFKYVEGFLKEADFGGAEKTHYQYWKDGRLKARIEPSLRMASYSYWPRGLLKEESYGSGDEVQRTGYTYDENGQLKTVTAGAGSGDARQWSYGRGARGELLTVTQPGTAGSFEYRHDALLRLTEVQPSAGSPMPKQTFGYDYLGRSRVRTRGPKTWNTAWKDGVATTTDPNGDRSSVVHDGRGRVASVLYVPGTASAPQTELGGVEYTYTADDQHWDVTEERVGGRLTNAFEYDERRLLKSVTRGGEAVRFEYTASGQRWKVTSPVGTVTYGYDALDRLASVSSSRGMTSFEWETGGARLLSIKDSALVERRCYDGFGRLEAVVNAGVDVSCALRAHASLLHSRFEYQYDGRGNRLQETYRDGSLTEDEVTRYGYDGADRLTGVRYPDGRAVLYALGGDGTRLAEKEVPQHSVGLGPEAFDSTGAPSRHVRYGFDSAGGLEGIYDELAGGGRTATYVTDGAGRVTSVQNQAGRRDFAWDAAGTLRQVVAAPTVAGGGGGTVTADYRYGFDGLRRSATVGDETTKFLWADGELFEEQLPGNPLRYENAAGLVTAVGSDRIAHDALGSAVGRMGATQSTQRFDAWGNYRTDRAEWTVPGSAQASLGFTGHAYAPESGLVYAQQRWLDTGTGRFLSEDPVFGHIGNPVGLNSWGYANANPTGYVDPDGRFAILIPPVMFAAKVVLAGIIGVEANIIYQEIAEGRDLSTVNYRRAVTFGLAASAMVMSGGLFGVKAAVGFALGGAGYDVASQMIMDDRALRDVSLESAFVSAGMASVVSPAIKAGFQSTWLGFRLVTGVGTAGLGVVGAASGLGHYDEGLRANSKAKMLFGAAEVLLSSFGSAVSLRATQRTAFQALGKEIYSKGLGTTFGNAGIREIRGLTLELRFKKGYDRVEFDRKVNRLKNAVARGEAISSRPVNVTAGERLNLTRSYRAAVRARAMSLFKSKPDSLKRALDRLAKSDIDHMLDLQVGGRNVRGNLKALHSKTNQGLGSQLQGQLPVGVRAKVVEIRVTHE